MYIRSVASSPFTFSPQPPHDLPRCQHLSEREPEAPQPRLMLRLIRAPTRILDEPSLKAPVERAPRRRIDAAIRHDATQHHPLDPTPFQPRAEIRADERIVGVLGHDIVILCYVRDLRQQPPVLAARGD